MKSKQLKILRKKLEKANKTGYDLPEGATLNNTANDEKENQFLNNDKVALTLQSWSPADLKTKGRLSEFVNLFEANMGEQYRQSSWGLNLEEKREELSHSKARFLVLLDSKAGEKDNLAGFCHYRFDYDDDESPSEIVLYVYELQIKEQYRRMGLGKRVMAILEQVAKTVELPKVMLTVFKSNQPALHFYQGIHYGMDENSPSQHGEFADYEILSKQVA